MKLPFRILLALCFAALLSVSAQAQSLFNRSEAQALTREQQTVFGPQSGKFRYDKRMLAAAQIAAERARGHSISRCWRYVKNALLAANAIDTYPSTALAKQAGRELQESYGFRKLKVSDPYKAPLGSVLVYGGKGAGHVEIRTKTGFVSDFASIKPSRRPLIGVYVKPRG